MKSNAYVYIKNTKNEYHLFYGYFELINENNKNDKYKINDINGVIEELFDSHIVQSGYRLSPYFKSFKITIGEYSIANEYNKQMSNYFCIFLKLYYHEYNICKIEPNAHTPYDNINDTYKVDNTISGISISIKNTNDIRLEENDFKYYIEQLNIKEYLYGENYFSFDLYKMNNEILKKLFEKFM